MELYFIGLFFTAGVIIGSDDINSFKKFLDTICACVLWPITWGVLFGDKFKKE